MKWYKLFLIVLAISACSRNRSESKIQVISGPEVQIVEGEVSTPPHGEMPREEVPQEKIPEGGKAEKTEEQTSSASGIEKGLPQGSSEENKEAPSEATQENPEPNPNEGSLSSSIWLIFGAISVGLNLFLIFLLRITIKSKNKHLKKRNQLERDLEWSKKNVESPNSNINQKQKFQPEKIKHPIRREERIPVGAFQNEEPSIPINLSPELPVTSEPLAEPPKPVMLFAEKAQSDRSFSNLSNQKDDHRSIYKLNLVTASIVFL